MKTNERLNYIAPLTEILSTEVHTVLLAGSKQPTGRNYTGPDLTGGSTTPVGYSDSDDDDWQNGQSDDGFGTRAKGGVQDWGNW